MAVFDHMKRWNDVKIYFCYSNYLINIIIKEMIFNFAILFWFYNIFGNLFDKRLHFFNFMQNIERTTEKNRTKHLKNNCTYRQCPAANYGNHVQSCGKDEHCSGTHQGAILGKVIDRSQKHRTQSRCQCWQGVQSALNSSLLWFLLMFECVNN